MKKKPTLWVIGDSFSQPRKEIDTPRTWPELVAERLGCEIVNDSFYGVSQDFCWMYLNVWLHEKRIQPDDYVIVVLTHPNRFWYIESEPDLSNGHWLIDLDDYVTKPQAQAIRGFIEHIQRPALDIIHQTSRLGWLAWQRESQGLRRPIILPGFEFDLYQAGEYSALNVAQGNMFQIQLNEFSDNDRPRHIEYFNGADPRYNHFSNVNHKILADKIVDSFATDVPVDLTSDFMDSVMPEGRLENDPKYCEENLNPELYEHYLKTLERVKHRGLTSWLAGVKR